MENTGSRSKLRTKLFSCLFPKTVLIQESYLSDYTYKLNSYDNLLLNQVLNWNASKRCKNIGLLKTISMKKIHHNLKVRKRFYSITIPLFHKVWDLFSEAWTSSVKHDCPLSEVLLPITMMDLIGNWEFKYSHTTALSTYMVHDLRAFLYTFFWISSLKLAP